MDTLTHASIYLYMNIQAFIQVFGYKKYPFFIKFATNTADRKRIYSMLYNCFSKKIMVKNLLGLVLYDFEIS